MTVLYTQFSDENISDEQLINFVRAGDEQATALLFSRMMLTVKSKAYAYSKRCAIDVDDLVQEGFMGLFCAINTFSVGFGACFKTYANVCINNRLVSVIKSSYRLKNSPLNNYVSLEDEQSDVFANTSTHFPSPEDEIISQEGEERIYSIINKTLSDFEQQVLMLYLSGHSYDSIAGVLSSSSKSVDNALQRVRRKLRVAVVND